MKTPYDTALRALQREVEDLRVSIGRTTSQLTQVQGLREAASETLAAEARLAADDQTFSPEPYLARMRAERERLAVEQREGEAQLATLREQAVETFGSLRAMEEAIGVFLAEAERVAASAEQAAIDDFAGARFARATRHARRAPGGRGDAR